MVPLFIQFVPYLIYVAIAILSLSVVIKLWTKKLNGKSLCLVGPACSGKTTFLYWLTNHKFVKINDEDRTFKTQNVKVDSIIDGDTHFTIRTVIDTPGHYELDGGEIFLKEIQANRYIIFFFDAKEYLTNKEYRENDVFPRLFSLWKVVKGSEKQLVLAGTHIDDESIKGRTKSQIAIDIQSLIQTKEYASIFQDYDTILCDLTTKEGFSSILKAITK